MLEYITREVCSISEQGTLRDVIKTMATGGFRHLPVVNAHGRLVGIISDRDVRSLLPAPGADPFEIDRFVEKTKVGEVMTRDPLTLDAKASMLEAVEKILEHRIGALPVLDDGRLVGIVSQVDLLRAFADHLGRNETVHIEEAPPAYLEVPFSAEQHAPLLFLVEPDAELRRSLSSVLLSSGVNLTSFEGLAEMVAHDGVETPDLILLSASTASEHDPLEMLREGYPMTPVVMTRNGRPKREELRGGKGPLFLPCSTETLLARVRGEIGFNRWTHDLPILSPPHLQVGRTTSIDIDIQEARRVLVVDNDALTRRILTYHLRSSGCEVTEARDGTEAMQLIENKVFDLITLELDLPFRSGLELLEELESMGPDAPPVVVVAGARRDTDVVDAFAHGAVDFIKKPLTPDVVEKRLRRVLSEA